MDSTKEAGDPGTGGAESGTEKQVIEQKEEVSEQPPDVEMTSETASKEAKAVAASDGVAADKEADVPETQGERDTGTSSSFSRLVKGWEALAEAGARNVQLARRGNETFQPLQMLQNLSLCGAGEGLARIGAGEQTGGSSGDPFEPIVLRHTHSTPLQYTPMFPDDDGGQAPPPIRLEHMRRSSSTPSSSAFRQRSAGSAFHLRSMPHLGDPDDRSAFTLPAQRNSYTSLSDSGVHYSAFDPVAFPQSMDTSENTAIEVMNVKPAPDSNEKEDQPGSQSKSAASRAARFLRMSDVRAMRRRKRLNGRENPAKPDSIASSPGSDNKQAADSVDDGTLPKSADAKTDSGPTKKKSTINIDISTSASKSPTGSFPLTNEDDDENNTKRASGSPSGPYQQLDSDIDEEYEHYQKIEASLKAESPTPIPSPVYQKFEDEQVGQSERRTESNDVVGGGHTPTVRIQVSTGQTTPEHGCRQPEGTTSLTPVSQDSGNQSSGTSRTNLTGNTSGHTTIATSTSATVSSGHMSVLSSVSETDIEVMETNQAGKMRIRQQRKLDRVVKGEMDSSASVTSSSTGSTNIHGYVALAGSPAPLREGASLPVDRFFDQSRLPVAHSTSTTSGSTGSSGSAPGLNSGAGKTNDITPLKRGLHGQGSPSSVSSEMATTNSSGSAGEEPPMFVSYLDRDKKNPLPPVDDAGERASPAEIVGYSEMVFEAANTPGQGSKQPPLIRPVQKRDPTKDRSGRFGSRPPLSPIKGLRTPTTPPPSTTPVGGPDSLSPAYHQLSPPRNIVDHRMGAGLSKPYVLRSSARAGDGQTQIYVTPDADRTEKAKGWAHGAVTSSLSSPEGAGPHPYTVDDSQQLGPTGSMDSQADQICEAMSIEVKNTDENAASEPSPTIVSPEKGA